MKISPLKILHKFIGQRCQLCSYPTDALLCPACQELLPLWKGETCPACGLPAKKSELCRQCQQRNRSWEKYGFYGKYEGELRRLILAYKFSSALGSGKILQQLLIQSFEFHELSMPDIIVPVPMHIRRLRFRGYNQALELSRGLAKKLQVKICPQAMRKIRHTPAQSELQREHRLNNLQHAFEADKNLVQGKNILLVDDIFTTGSTLEQCSFSCLQAGARKVEILFLARAVL